MWARLPSKMFLPYVTLFFTHLYPIMPIIDRKVYLNPELYTKYSCLTSENYAFLSALSAATIVQLDVAAQLTQDSNVLQADCGPPGELYISECLRERQRYDYIENPITLTVMTSFFIFCYYGNLERHEKAWHFLQESISFAQVLNLDDEHAILELDPTEAQWRRRLYWLLFITERAYAIQRRKHTRLHPSIQLPLVFSSEDAQLLNGFVNLVHLFSAVNDDFVKVWRGQRKKSLCSEPWLAGTQHALDATAFALQDVTETQQLDIEVSREWLHVLAWQMGVSNGLLWSPHDEFMRLDYPVGLAKKVVKITQGANPVALDSHGIGMEQKLSDIVGCLADVLRCAAGDQSETFMQGREYLNILLQQLSSRRGKESRYLRPLVSKMGDLVGYPMSPALALPAPDGVDMGSVYEEQEVGSELNGWQ
ncbi:hypothetical protein LTR04_003089 [Oleoguttula sp. CCFEE 6159]|nr:hypothetical protein LTR04_003089 [Oleoguttula sp. CCFEE 6159]